jgi:hypothetical protein
MAEKRLDKRVRRRVALRFGTDGATRLGFTEDISPEGLFIKTTDVATPGSRLTVTLILQDDKAVTLEGRVMWAKKVPSQMIRLVKKCGLGLKIERFIEGEELYRELCEKTLTPA